MGDPGRVRSKYDTPMHPWEQSRIEEERALLKEYGLKNKKEIWKMNSILKHFTSQAKRLTVQEGAQAEKERAQLLQRIARYGLLQAGSDLSSILNLNIRNILDRRLQTIAVKRGLARSPRQARQFITHRHVMINGQKITSPSYLVPVSEENQITFVANSNLADEEHPERAVKKEVPGEKEETKEEKKETKKAKKKAPKKEEKKEVKEETTEKKEEKPEAKEESPKEEPKPEEKKEEAPKGKKPVEAPKEEAKPEEPKEEVKEEKKE